MRARRSMAVGSFVCGLVLLVVGATTQGSGGGAPPGALAVAPQAISAKPATSPAVATFAAGCFWCVEADFDKVPGVLSTVSGFTGGARLDPTYEQVSAGGTGHAESVEVTYDPNKVTYEQLLDFYWHHVDPFTADRQFCDVGGQVPSGDLLSRRRREAPGGAVEGSNGSAVQEEDRCGDCRGVQILPGRGVPPGFLQEEPGPIPRSTGSAAAVTVGWKRSGGGRSRGRMGT